MRHQMAKSKEQRRPKFLYLRTKIWMAQRSPVKMWRNIFAPIENIFDTKVQKNQVLRLKRSVSA